VIVAYGLGAWVLLRTVMGLIPALRTELGPRLPWLLAAPALLLITVFCLRVVQQALDFERVFELHRLADSNRNLLFGYLAGAAMFNFSFMGLVTLRLTRRLREQSRHDALTGLPNRRVLEHELEREWQRLQRSGERFAVLALDLDHFKRVNDEHGHLAGDAVLSQIAQRVRQVVRQVDTAARTGGEEFVVLMPQGDLAGALAAAERVRAGVKAAPFELPEGQVALTISIGVALAEATDTDVRQVLQRADRALYRAKEAGRDRVMAD
jgi:diguanylate cyclase (GGDEF)-like protein